MNEEVNRNGDGEGFLEGQFLIAMPSMGDSRFARSVVYLCAHSSEGAMGIIVNHIAAQITFRELLVQLNVIPEGEQIRLPEPVEQMQVHLGGPVETRRGFVLHTKDYFVEDSTLEIDGNVSLTATVDILKAIAGGSGPRSALLALGYAGWAPGQLENEIKENGWLHCPAKSDVIFDEEHGDKYSRALAIIGVDLPMLSGEAGRA